MNNSKIAIDSFSIVDFADTTVILRQRQTELLKIIEALQGVIKTDQWQVLKELMFDGLVESLQRRLQTEASKNELNSPEIYRLNGQLLWAKRYSDLNKLTETYKVELNQITKKLNENANN